MERDLWSRGEQAKPPQSGSGTGDFRLIEFVPSGVPQGLVAD